MNDISIGDRVRVILTAEIVRTIKNKIINGATGTVKDTSRFGSAGVEFDDDIGGVTGFWDGKDGHCWYVPCERLEKIEDIKWVVGLDKDHFNCDETYYSKEEAIDVGRKELMNAKPHNPASFGSYSDIFMADMADSFMCFYVGRLIRPEPKADIDNIIEDLVSNAVYIYDEYYNDFLEDVTDKQREELEHDIDKVIQNWLDKHNLRDYGYLVDDVERVFTEIEVKE